MFQPHRDVPEGWQAQLEAVVPKAERVPWLALAWLAGRDYAPVQRWGLYEMTPTATWCRPEQRANDLVLFGLEGPRPDTHGTWRTDKRGVRRWRANSTVSQLQWDLYREYGKQFIPVLFWIIQGTHGGHRWTLSPIEQRFVHQVYGEDVQMPAPGELAYADFDARVLEHVARYDRLKSWERSMMTPWEARTLNLTEAGLWLAKEDQSLEENYARELNKMLIEQIDGAINDMTRREAGVLASSAITVDDDPTPDLEVLEAQMITSAVHS